MGGERRILVVGGGFAGVYATRELEHLLGADPGAEITRENSPLASMLHEVSARVSTSRGSPA
jgi:NADH dehydrogenase FAD-containing subunit